MRLFRLELKRVIKTRTTWILLAAALLLSSFLFCFPAYTLLLFSFPFETRNVVEDGVEKELTGFDAIRVKRQAQAGIAGEITEAQLKAAAETAVRVLREYEKEYMYQLPTEVYVEKILPVAPLLSRVPEVYADAETSGKVCTLRDLRQKLLEQPEAIAQDIALTLELYTDGTLDIFGQESNVNLENRILVFDIHELSEQLKPAGLLVITDTILNRVNINWKQGRRTHIFIDEFHVVFGNEQGANFFDSAWRQFRKRGAYPTAITQNCEYLLNSPIASMMLSNSECTIMLSQAASDRQELARLLHISDDQMSYCTNTRPGCGLLKYGSALVPFVNEFPEATQLYRLMTTRPGEGIFGGGGHA